MADSPIKKHKKHKKHKHKRKHVDGEEGDIEGDLNMDVTADDGEEEVDIISTGQPTIRLKIKLGNESGKNKKHEYEKTGTDKDDFKWEEGKVKGEDIFPTKKAGDDTSDEEREWLDALEAGTLDDSGSLKRNLDESLLTSRQRALLHGKAEADLLELPSGYKMPELTEEQLKRRQQRAKKRREQAIEKQEKDKRQTLDRLLKKQDTKLKGSKPKGNKRLHIPGIRYTSNTEGNFICIPHGVQSPFMQVFHKNPPAVVFCAVDGCKNKKKYSCSKTGLPLCSLQCYKINLSKHQGAEHTATVATAK